MTFVILAIAVKETGKLGGKGTIRGVDDLGKQTRHLLLILSLFGSTAQSPKEI